jgi:hypothetical protein
MIKVLQKSMCRLCFMMISFLFITQVNAQVDLSGKITSAYDQTPLPGRAVSF